MLGIRDKDASIPEARKQDISLWHEADVRRLNSKAKKCFANHKSAITTYFTTDKPIEEIAVRHNLSAERLMQMAKDCLKQHQDGTPWGYRALLPDILVKDHVSSTVSDPSGPSHPISDDKVPVQEACDDNQEATAKRSVISIAPVSPVNAIEPPMKCTALQLVDSSNADHRAVVESMPTSQEVTVDVVARGKHQAQVIAHTIETEDKFITAKRERVKSFLPACASTFSPVDAYILPPYTTRSVCTAAVRIAQRRRLVRRRWLRNTQDKTKRQHIYRIMSIALITMILLSFLFPLGVGLAAYNVYHNVNDLAHRGVNDLLAVKALLPSSKSDLLSALNANKLLQAQGRLKAAEGDFVQLQQLVNRPDIQAMVQQVAPTYANKLAMAKHLIQVALDVSRMGQELSGVAIIAAGIVHSSPLATHTTKPLVSVGDLATMQGAVVHALYYINDIQQNMSQVQLNALPISAKQRTMLGSVLIQLPSIHNLIVQNQELLDTVAWLLGIGQDRRFLVQTMDTAELRPGGGFTGQYGILSIHNGRMDTFSLRDVALLDYAGNGMELGRQAPPAYRNWMNFGNWGLRDSNLSGDFPTTARMSMQVFQEEGGGPVDGDIALTPKFIGHIIDVTGPLHVAEYNETITASNLEDRLHYYQQNYDAIAIEHQKSNDSSHAARKAFTSLLGKMLLERVRHLPTKQLLAMIKGAVKDIQSRDLEIYFSNPGAEQWLIAHDYSGDIDTFRQQDGFIPIQANVSISKASQYVHTTERDHIVLDAQGGATHHLTLGLNYNQVGPVYGFDTYSDYVRVYVPRSSQLIGGSGFDSGHPLCESSTQAALPCDSLPPGSTLYCPAGNYNLGTRSYNVAKSADVMGGPTTTTSDLPGRGMWGGMTVTPKDCVSSITLSWYVPNVVKYYGQKTIYTLLVQKQGGYTPTLEVSVDTSAIKRMKPFSFKGNLNADQKFTVA